MTIKIMAAAMLLASSMPASAAIITLTDGNSSVDVNDTTGAAENWYVDSFGDQLFTQRYFYRIGNSGGESDLSSLTLSNASVLGGRYLDLQYTGSSFTLDITYALNGGSNGSGVSVLSQDVEITNTSGSTLDLHFFQYNDFDLFGIGGQTVTQTNANTVTQSNSNTILSEQIGTPAPDLFQVDGYPVLINALNDSSATTLNGNSTYSGDATWAWQWDFSLASNDSVVIGEDLRLEITSVSEVPVPAAVWLFASGLLGLAGIARRKKA